MLIKVIFTEVGFPNNDYRPGFCENYEIYQSRDWKTAVSHVVNRFPQLISVDAVYCIDDPKYPYNLIKDINDQESLQKINDSIIM